MMTTLTITALLFILCSGETDQLRKWGDWNDETFENIGYFGIKNNNKRVAQQPRPRVELAKRIDSLPGYNPFNWSVEAEEIPIDVTIIPEQSQKHILPGYNPFMWSDESEETRNDIMTLHEPEVKPPKSTEAPYKTTKPSGSDDTPETNEGHIRPGFDPFLWSDESEEIGNYTMILPEPGVKPLKSTEAPNTTIKSSGSDEIPEPSEGHIPPGFNLVLGYDETEELDGLVIVPTVGDGPTNHQGEEQSHSNLSKNVIEYLIEK